MADSKESQFVPQHEVAYNKHLPYQQRIKHEAATFLAEIKHNLGRAVILHEINPGLLQWTIRLDKYIRLYGMNFSKEDHVTLVNLLYHLMVVPDMEAQFVKWFAYVLHKLLKKRRLLSREDLQLPWRPLYNLIESVRYSYASREGLRRYRDNLMTYIYQVASFARCYFSEDSTKEMLLEWRPLMCPLDHTKEKAAYYLCRFLPTKLGNHGGGYQLWLDEFMNYWFLLCTEKSQTSESYTELFTRTAEENTGRIDWNPYLPKIFNHFLSALRLPGSKSVREIKCVRVSDYAKWFVYMIGGQSTVLDHLSKFFVVTKSFYHPSNYGNYSLALQEFLMSLTEVFVKRVHEERFAASTWLNNVDEVAKISDAEIELFVGMLKEVAFFSMYSKTGSTQSAVAIHNLALLRADCILPPLLDKTYEALETLIEPHQVSATLSCIAAISRVLVGGGGHMPDAPTHVIKVLQSVLPGIDPNDPNKSYCSFSVISSIVHLIPFVDCTPALRSGVAMTKIEKKLSRASVQFEEFAIQFIDRCFNMIEVSAGETLSEQENTATTLSKSILKAVVSTVHSVLIQSSPDLFQKILEKLFRFISSHVLEGDASIEVVASLCRTASKVNPRLTLKKFVPSMCSMIKDLASESDDEDGDDEEENTDSKLLWYLELLSETSRCDGTALLHYKEMFKEVLHITLPLKCRKTYERAGKLLNALLSSCLSVFATETCSIAGGFADPPEEHFYIRDWGKPGDLDNLDVKWHVPNKEEVEFAEELLQEFLLPEMEVLKSYANSSFLTNDQLLQHLKIVNLAVYGASLILPDWKNEPVAERDVMSLVSRCQFDAITSYGSSESFQSTITRKDIALLMHELLLFILKNNEDDTKALREILKIYDSLIFYHGYSKREYDERLKGISAAKKAPNYRDYLNGKKLLPRSILIKRVQLQHDLRLVSKERTYTEMDELLVKDLLLLSTSDYTQVRIDAQDVMFRCFEVFEDSARGILSTLLDNLKPENGISHEKLKGTLYILLNSNVVHMIAQSWEHMKIAWPIIVRLDQSEKPSIISLNAELVDEILSKFETLTFDRTITENCRNHAQALLRAEPIHDTGSNESPAIPSEELISKGKNLLEKHNDDHRKFYGDLRDQLIECIEDPNLHWRCVEKGLKLMGLLINHEVQVSAKFAKVIVNMMVHESVTLRTIAIKALPLILIQQKRVLPKREIPLSMYGIDKSVDSLLTLSPGDSRDDCKWLQYRSNDAPKSQDDLDKTVFMDKMYVGYYAYPAVIKTYESHSVLKAYSCDLNTLTDVAEVIYDAFCENYFRDRFFKFISLEKKKGKDSFSPDNCKLFTALFKHFQSELLRKCEVNIQELARDQDSESKQRCCSELLGGCLRGAKNWNFQQLTYMWEFVGVQLKIIYHRSIMPEILYDWGRSFYLATTNRDPNRFHALYNILLDNPISGDGGSLGDSSRLYIIQCVMAMQKWRAAEMFHQVYNYLLLHLDHPFKQVRDQIASLLAYTFTPDIHSSCFKSTLSPHVKDFVDHVFEDLQIISKEVIEMDMQDTEVEDVPIDMCSLQDNESETLNCNRNEGTDVEKKRRDRVAKTVLSFLYYRLPLLQSLSSDVYRLIQVLIPLESRKDDPEMVTLCQALFPGLSSKHIPEDIVDIALDAVITTCNYTSWNARRTGLNFLKNMIYHNIFTFDNDVIREKVTDVVVNRLQDEQLEIRQLTSTILSGFVHFGYLQVTQQLLDQFLLNSHQKIYKIRHGVAVTDSQLRENVVSLRLCHAGVLGLSACVLAFPYEVPLWMPKILLELGNHLQGSPQVQDVVEKTFSEFRRTHHDNWNAHQEKFSADQLDVLTDILVSPKCYA